MPPKKKRRTRPQTSDDLASSMGPKDAVDLFVPLAAKNGTTLSSQAITSIVLRDLKSSGYVKCALTHVVYGKPQFPDDLASNAIPKASFSNAQIKVLRRLHVIVESIADVGLFAPESQPPIASLLAGYDIISLGPRNSSVLDAVCRSHVDIVTMEYYSMQSAPFRWKRSHIRELHSNGTRLEIPYAPALLDARACRNLMILCNDAVTTAPNILLSSGPRIGNDDDNGPQALRRPGDMLNFAHVVMGLAARSLPSAMRWNPQRQEQDKVSDAIKVKNAPVNETATLIPRSAEAEEVVTTQGIKPEAKDSKADSLQHDDTEDEGEDGDDDGFIPLS